MDLELNGKLALVTGSTAGIGHAIAAALVREGARVIVNGRTQDAVGRAVAELAAIGDGDVEGFAGDLGTAEATEALAKRFPNVEILINNLGIFEPKPFEEIPDGDWRQFFDVNVLSGVRLARRYLPSMRQRNRGRIIFISSESGLHIPAEMVHYGVSKAAQIARYRGICRWHCDHSQQHPARPDQVARHSRFRRGAGGIGREVFRTVRDRVLREGAADLAHQAFREARRGGGNGCLCGQPAVFGYQRGSSEGGWRGGEECVLTVVERTPSDNVA
jgi:short-subunit dehydrogenase involved in D-alanine esterification of teichoic acids